MTDLQIFKNNEFGEIRTVSIEGTPYFIGVDIARNLGYKNTSKAINDHCRSITKWEVPHPQSKTKTIEMNVIPESDLYRLVVNSELPEAEKFEKWVFEEVLPSIRKHGAYLTDSKIEEVLMDPDTIIKLATQLKEERIQKQALEFKVKEDKPKVLFAQAVENSEDVILVKEMATIITQNGFTIGQNQLFQYLRDNEFLCKKLGDMYHLPTKRYEHFFKVTKNTIQSSNKTRVRNTPKVTGKGQMYFIKKFEAYKNEGLTIKDLLTKEGA